MCATISINKTIVFGLRLQRLLVRHSQETKACARDTMYACTIDDTVRGECQTHNGRLQRCYAANESANGFDSKTNRNSFRLVLAIFFIYSKIFPPYFIHENCVFRGLKVRRSGHQLPTDAFQLETRLNQPVRFTAY